MNYLEIYQNNAENIDNPYQLLSYYKRKGYSDEEIRQKMYINYKNQNSNLFISDSFSNILAKAIGKVIGKSLFIYFKL